MPREVNGKLQGPAGNEITGKLQGFCQWGLRTALVSNLWPHTQMMDSALYDMTKPALVFLPHRWTEAQCGASWLCCSSCVSYLQLRYTHRYYTILYNSD